ncbi:MAG: glycosyl hydrolase, partial [Woeseiaceae bacterium]
DKGLNRFVWDLRYPGMERFDDLIMWSDMRVGPKAVPGTYRAELTLDDVVRDVDFEVLADPRSSTRPSDYRAQFEFIVETRNLLSAAHTEVRKIRRLRTQLEALQVRLEQEAESDSRVAALLGEVSAIMETIDPIEEAIYQTQNESRQDPLNYPIRLNNKLTSLMRTVDVGDARPTAGAVGVRDELGAALESELELLESVWEQNVPALNSQIDEMGIDLVSISDE